MSNAKFWDRAAPKYAKSKIGDPAAYSETLGRMRQILQPHHRVLELGCGTGSTALELAPGVQSYVGTDLSAGMIEIARGKLSADLPADLAFEVAQAGAIPAGPFDAILALNLLHLLPTLEADLKAIFAALPEGGLFVAKTGLLKDGAWFLRPIIPVMQFFGKAPYVRSLSATELRDLLTSAGFTMIEELVQPGMAPRMFTVAQKPA